MGKIVHIKSSRKEHKCSKCGQVIPKGSAYIKGEINFSPDIIRCSSCGLKSWEVTTSDYTLALGPIIEEWACGIDDEEFLSDAESIIDSVRSDLENVRDDQQDRLDNMPESLQDGDVGQMIQERIDQLDEAIDMLYDIDVDHVLSAEAEAVMEDISEDNDEDPIEDVMNKLKEKGMEDRAKEFKENVASSFKDLIEEALNVIEF